MSKNIKKEELDRILTDIYDTEVPKEKRFSFSTEGLDEKIRKDEQPHEKADVISVSSNRKNMFKRITAIAASAAIMIGVGTFAFRNVQIPLEKDGVTSDESSVSQVTTAVSEIKIDNKYNGSYYKFEKLEYPEGYFSEALSSKYFVMNREIDDNNRKQILYRMDYDHFKLEKISENYDFESLFEVSAEGNPYLISPVLDNNQVTGTEVFRIAQDGSRERMSWEKTVVDGRIDNGIITDDGRSLTFETEFFDDFGINVRIDFHDAEGNVIYSETVAERVMVPYLKFYTSSSGKLIASVEYRNNDDGDFTNFFYTVDYDNQKIEHLNLMQTEIMNVYDGYGKYDLCCTSKDGENFIIYGICIDDGSIEKIELPDNPDIKTEFINANYEKRMDDGTVFLFNFDYILKATPCSAEEFDYTEFYNTVYGSSCTGSIVFESEEAIERYGKDGFVSMLEKRMEAINIHSNAIYSDISYSFEADSDKNTVTMNFITAYDEKLGESLADYLSGKNNFTIRKGDSKDGEILFTNSDIEYASAGFEYNQENDTIKSIININITEEAAVTVNDIDADTIISAWLDGTMLISSPVSDPMIFSSGLSIDFGDDKPIDEFEPDKDKVTAWKMVSEPVDFDIRVVSSDIRYSDNINE